MARLPNDILLFVGREQFSGSIKGGDFAVGVNRKGSDAQIIQQRAQLLIENQRIFFGSLSSHAPAPSFARQTIGSIQDCVRV
jgi:hypothetical protein